MKGDQPAETPTPIPPIQRHTIDLRSLTKDEEEYLRSVLERDYVETEILDTRLNAIRQDIQEIRRRGALARGDNLNTMCARCKHKFWLLPLPLTDRGARCIKCKFRVCRMCRYKEFNGTWMCSLCFRYREEKILSGEWMFKGLCIGLHGSDLMRASLRDKDHPRLKGKQKEGQSDKHHNKDKGKSRKGDKHSDKKDKKKDKKKKKEESSKSVGIRALLDKTPPGDDEPKKKKKKRELMNDMGEPIDIIGEGEDKKKTDENQSWREAVIKKNASETKRLAIALDMGPNPGPSTMVSEFPKQKSTDQNKGKWSYSNFFPFSRSKAKPDPRRKMTTKHSPSPSLEGNLFADQEMNTNNRDIEPAIEQGEKKVDKMTENLDGRQNTFHCRVRQQVRSSKRKGRQNRKLILNNVISLPPIFRKAVDLFRKRPKTAESQNGNSIPKKHRKQKGNKWENAGKRKKRRAVKNPFRRLTLFSKKMEEADIKKKPSNSLHNVNYSSKPILLGCQNVLNSRRRANDKSHYKKTPTNPPSQLKDSLSFQNTSFRASCSTSSKRSVRLDRNNRSLSGASGDGKDLQLSDISGTNINVNFQPAARTIVKQNHERDKLSRKNSKTIQTTRKQSPYKSTASNEGISVSNLIPPGQAVLPNLPKESSKTINDAVSNMNEVIRVMSSKDDIAKPQKPTVKSKGAGQKGPPVLKRGSMGQQRSTVSTKESDSESSSQESNRPPAKIKEEKAQTNYFFEAKSSVPTSTRESQTRVRKRSKVVKALCPFCKFSVEYGAEF